MKSYLDITSSPNPSISNCPVERDDVIAAEDIFGTNLCSLKGKTIRKNTKHVRVRKIPLSLPPITLDRYIMIELPADIIKINGPNFFQLSLAI